MEYENRFYVYELIDPRTNMPFYVGKGCGNRAESHIIEALRPRYKQVNPFKCAIINNIIASGRDVIIHRVQLNMTESAAYKLEKELVAKYGKKDARTGGGILTNIANGGKGGTGGGEAISQHTISGALVQIYDTLTEAALYLGINKSTICAALNGRTNLAGGFRWSYLGEVLRPYISDAYVAVDKFDLDGTFLKSYNSIHEAITDCGINFGSVISDCIRVSNVSSAGGFRWALKGEQPKPFTKHHHIPPSRKEYACYTKQGEFIAKYSTIKEAIANTSANSTGIVDCCAGRKKSSGGLVWKAVQK